MNPLDEEEEEDEKNDFSDEIAKIQDKIDQAKDVLQDCEEEIKTLTTEKEEIKQQYLEEKK